MNDDGLVLRRIKGPPHWKLLRWIIDHWPGHPSIIMNCEVRGNAAVGSRDGRPLFMINNLFVGTTMSGERRVHD